MTLAGHTRGTAHTAAFVLPPHAVPGALPCRQVPIGDNMLNHRETVYLDPFALYPGLIRNRNTAFIGDVGNGKSGQMKCFLERMLLLPERLPDGSARLRRAVILDRKGEYRRMTEMLKCRPVVVGHGTCVNPLDERLSPQQQLAVLEAFLRLLMGRSLTPFETELAAGAYEYARRRVDPAGPFLLDDVRHALMHLPDEFVAETLHTRAEVDHAASELAFALKHLITGSLRGMFDGPTTEALDWRGQVITIQVHPDYLVNNRELVYQLLVSCVAVWLDRAWQAVDARARVDFLVVDEAWDVVKARQGAELLQDATKLGRSQGLCVLMAFHGPSDFRSAGDEGEAQVAMAERALKDMGVYFLFRMPAEDAEMLRGIAKLTDEDVDLISDLEPHQFLLVMGSGSNRRRFLVTHDGRLTAAEREMVDTDRLN